MKSIPQTKELIEKFCEKEGLDFQLVKNMYNYYTKQVKQKVSSDPNEIEIPINYLGVIHTTRKNENRFMHKNAGKGVYDISNFHADRKQAVNQRIAEKTEDKSRFTPFLKKWIPFRRVTNK